MNPNLYASGEKPMRRDTIVHADKTCQHPEADETWIVVSVYGDMVRAKAEGKERWRQAFYCRSTNLAQREDKGIKAIRKMSRKILSKIA